MKENQILNIEYKILKDRNKCVEEIKKLIHRAKKEALNSYSPYSNFRVGASALLSDGSIVSAHNIENAAYPQCLCAEMALVSKCQHVQGLWIKAIAVYSPDLQNRQVLSPCGSCRQILLEHEIRQNQAIEIYLLDKEERIIVLNSIQSLLPFSFSEKSMDSYQPL